MNKDISKQNDKSANEANKKTADRRKRSVIGRLFKWLLMTVLSVLIIVLILLTGVVFILSPGRLTPIVNHYACEYVNADVEAKKVELSFWSTFPKFSVSVDSLQVVSHAFSSLPDSVRAELPDKADSLLLLKHFSGAVSVPKLLLGKVEIYDIDIVDTHVNLVAINDSVANYLITPPAADEPASEEALSLPDILIDRFTISDDLSVSYCAPAESIDCTVTVRNLNLVDSVSSEPLYALELKGDAGALLPALKLPQTPFFANGLIGWNSARPLAVALQNFSFGVGDVAVNVNTEVDMTDTLVVRELDVKIPRVNVNKVLDVIPDDYTKALQGLDTDLAFEMSAKALAPFRPLENELPVLDAEFIAKATKVKLDRMNLHKLDVDVAARIDCARPDKSVITMRQLAMAGKAMNFTLDGVVKYPMSDPFVDARFDGSLTIQNLPSKLLSMLPCALRGAVHGVANINTRLSYLSPKMFYRSKIDGEVTVDDFRAVMTDGSMETYMRHAAFKFGSCSKSMLKEHVIDSMLTASFNVDTMAILAPGMSLSGSDLMVGVGAKNTASSSDTTQINPIGATIKVGRMTMRSDSDSVRIRVRDSHISASVFRYKGDSRSPMVVAVMNSAAMRYADGQNRAGIRDAEMKFTLHPRPRPQMSAARKARFDSLAALYPTLSSDSIMRMMMQKRDADILAKNSGRENVNVELDNSIYSFLRRWQAGGDFKAKTIRLFTPYFPARSSMKNVDFSFSTDSVVVRNTKLYLGNSDFLLNGSVRNLSRAILSRTGTPYELDFSLESDTIDVNNLTATMLRGAVFAEKISEGTISELTDTDSDAALQKQLDTQVADTTKAAVLVPSNVNAQFALKARHVLYADLWLHGLDGLIEVFDGAVNLDRLRAYTSIGAVNFTALYSAPTVEDLSLAAAIRLKRLNLRSVLDMMPGIDSILPLLNEVRGIVDADLALTTRIDSVMDFDLSSLSLALNISGDSLQLLDNETFRTISKWMMFKHKERNLIDRMDVELAVHDGYVDLYPFIFDIDRYRIGVRGSNDAAFNLNYHVAVLKSPVPFKFGINIKGTPEKMKIRLGKARVNEKTVAESRKITDTVRVNLASEISDVFRRGVKATGSRGLQLKDSRAVGSGSEGLSDEKENLTRADSINLIQHGLIEKPEGFIMPGDTVTTAPAEDSKVVKKKK